MVLKLAEEIIVGAELWDRITSSMVARMKDKQTSVRVFAARALSRLIVLENIEDEFAVKAYREALKSDTSSVSFNLNCRFRSSRAPMSL